MNSSRIKKILILVTILTVPGFLYYLLQDQGKNRYKSLPFFGEKVPASTFHTKRGKQIRDTIYHTPGTIDFLTQDGKELAFDNIKDKVIIANLFYINGGFAAKTSTTIAEKFYNTYKNNKRIQFLSFTVDPINDTPTALKRYTDSLKLSTDKWLFLTADPVKMDGFIKNGLMLDVMQSNGKIAYSNIMVLMDHEHRIRGYYEITNREAIAKLDDEIKVLMAEELRNLRDGR